MADRNICTDLGCVAQWWRWACFGLASEVLLRMSAPSQRSSTLEFYLQLLRNGPQQKEGRRCSPETSSINVRGKFGRGLPGAPQTPPLSIPLPPILPTLPHSPPRSPCRNPSHQWGQQIYMLTPTPTNSISERTSTPTNCISERSRPQRITLSEAQVDVILKSQGPNNVAFFRGLSCTTATNNCIK